MQRRIYLSKYMMLTPTVIILILLTVFPLFYALYMSLWDVNLSLPWQRLFVGIGNYISTIKDDYFIESLKASAIFVTLAVGIELILGMGIALLLNHEIRAAGIFRAILLIPMTVPPVVTALTWRLMYHPELGILNYYLGKIGIKGLAWLAGPASAMGSVVAVDVWQWTPFVALVLFAGLLSLPKEPYEAARIGGASAWQTFTHITIPMLRPQILVIVLLRLLDAIRTFDTIFILTGGGPSLATEVMSLYIYRVGFGFFRMGYASALSVILLIVIIAVANILVRVIQERETKQA